MNGSGRLNPELRGQAKAHRLSRTVEDRHFRRRNCGQGPNHLLDNDLRRGGAGRHSDHSGVAHPFRVDFAAVGDKVARNPDLVANLAQPVGVGAVAGAHDDDDVGDLAQLAHGSLSILCRVADVANIRTHDVAEAAMQRGDHTARIVNAQRRLGNVGDRRLCVDRKLFDVLLVFDEVHGAINLPERPFDFRMPVMANEHQDAALSDVSSPLIVHLGDQRTSRVDGRKRPQLRFVFNLSRHAVGAEDRHRLPRARPPGSRRNARLST